MYSHSKPAIPPQGVIYPLDWLGWLKDTTSLAELKVLACVYGYDGIIGIDSQHPTFSDLVQLTGMTERSVSDGLKRAIEKQKVKLVDSDGGRHYCPLAKGIAHDHDHDINTDSLGLNTRFEHEHDHGAEDIARKNLLKILLTEFGMSQTTRTERIAYDICLTPKYTIDRIQSQVRYTRYEITRGEDGEPARPIRNPAGRLVYRIRGNIPMPQGYSLLAALEAEGMTRAQIYDAIYNGELDIPEIEDSHGYVSWLKFEKWAQDDES